MNEQELKIFKKLFNQNKSYVYEIANATRYCKRRIRIAKQLLNTMMRG